MVLISVSDLSYVRAIWRREAQPHRYTWFIFLMTALVIFGSQLSLGSTTSLFVFGWFVIVNATIFFLSLTKARGEGGIDAPNTVALGIALMSVVLWFFMESPLAALACILVADTIGIGLSLVKTWRNPLSEPLLMWGLGSIAALLNIVAVGGGHWFLYLAPAHLAACDIAMAFVIVYRKGRVSVPVPEGV